MNGKKLGVRDVVGQQTPAEGERQNVVMRMKLKVVGVCFSVVKQLFPTHTEFSSDVASTSAGSRYRVVLDNAH